MKVKIAVLCVHLDDTFTGTLSNFDSRSDENVGKIICAIHGIDFCPPDAKSIYSASYPAGPKAGEIGTDKFDNILLERSLISAQVKRAALRLLAYKENGMLNFCVKNRNLMADTKRHVGLLLWMYEGIESSGKAAALAMVNAISG